MFWIGVDVGGTFTDLVAVDDETGEMRVAKQPSTPSHPDEAVLSVVDAVCGNGDLAAAGSFIHGTTVGLNALLQRDHEGLALLTTRGFRDVLEIRRGDRAELYNLFWHPPPPLVPRRLRLEITERTGADGSVVVPLSSEEVTLAAQRFIDENIEAVAIVFLHSYANPAHELEALSELRAAGFAGDVSLSHLTSGEFREYERTCTTLIDAYVRPQVTGYLRQLKRGLTDAGFAGETLIMRSGGGAMTFGEAEARPFETILSGPVAGADGASLLARELDLPTVVTADVGGTSFDTSLIVSGKPQTLYEGVVDGLPVQAPWVDVRSIGAGGGSIAFIDTGGLLRVGPRSAGAVPGPACYGAGGDEATVTDAALVLGMLGEGILASGRALDRELASAAIARLAEPLRLSIEEAARGILEIVTASMANTISEITIDQGEDPRQATLMAFGGAGPLFCTLLARQLGITRIVVPPNAGNFSAYGLLVADLVQSAARTSIHRVADGALADGNEILAQLFATLENRTTDGPNRTDTNSVREVALDIRYVGQDHTITVHVPCAADGTIALAPSDLLARFGVQYEKTYASGLEEPVEVITWRATVRTEVSHRRMAVPSTRTRPDATQAPRTLPAYSLTEQAVREFQILDRSSLGPSDAVRGPAIVIEDTATTYLDAGFSAEAGHSGALVIADRREE